jgi:hypothetical protein
MRKYSKFIVVAGSLAALAVPSAAMADPAGYQFKANGTNSNGNQVAVDSSRLTGNGQAPSNPVGPSVSQQAQAGDRAANIQMLLGH